MSRRLAFLSLDQSGDFVIDDDLALAPLADLGWIPEVVSWRQDRTPWEEFAAVIIRSTWDYWDDVEAFLATLAAIDRATRLANPLGLVRWNLAKTYLRELERAGVPIVPTLWLDGVTEQTPAECRARLGSDEIVIKPVVGANGEDAFRLSGPLSDATLQQVAARFPGRPAMAQPFVRGVIDEGEYSLFHFSGEFSHAIVKRPADGEFRTQEERGAEIQSVVPEPALANAARRALDTLDPAPLYARTDLVRDADGSFCVMELELIEPSLYLRTDPNAPGRFAEAIDHWLTAQT
ncbi:ATP-grasp domain-containing protein [Elongatibacter sediminis]|uniref:ATP-grasp domain-containing protein n=1 Tax=Elongatibacter sediminis TaxID=3119006 RepID=A0AAW9R8T4_9GAMM